MRLKKGLYIINNNEFNRNNYDDWTIRKVEEKCYTYDEAVDMTGHGLHSIGLLLTSVLSIFSCLLDLFAFPAVTTVAACDLHLTSREENILLSLPFLGAMIMAYPWGYISDIKGRRVSMLVSLWVSFISSCLAAFSPHWIVLGVLKFISVSCSSCAFTTAYTFVGECCSAKVKAIYFFLLTSAIHVTLPFQMGLHYYALSLDFSYDLGVTEFLPWRMFAILLALPLGISALFLQFHHESPKFLLNAGEESKAIEILGHIWKRNGRVGDYPVKKLFLNEDGNSRPSGVLFWQSLWNQTKPLFQKPLLFRTLQLYYLGFVLYASCGGLLSWFPYLANAFISGTLSEQSSNSTEGFCNMISRYSAVSKELDYSVSCVHKSDIMVVWASLIQGFGLSIINITISAAANRRKLVMITIVTIAGLSAFGCGFFASNVASVIAYFSIYLAIMGAGIILSYFVDLYPTSYRGMVSCLSMVVCRASNIVALNFIGSQVMEHCNFTFYTVSALLLSGALVSCFLPRDKPNNKS